MAQFTELEKHFILVIAGKEVSLCSDIVRHLAHPSEWGIKWEDSQRINNGPFKLPHKLSFSGNLFGKKTSGNIQLEGSANVLLMKRDFEPNKQRVKQGSCPRILLDWTEIRFCTECILNPAKKRKNDEYEPYALATKGGIRALVEAICVKLSNETEFLKGQSPNLKKAVEGVLARVNETSGKSIPSLIKASWRYVESYQCTNLWWYIGVDSTVRSF
jgi:hypothetical protein